MTFYQLDAAWGDGNLWHIGDIAEVADWQFDLLDRVPAPMNLHAPVAHHGAETDFSIGWRSFFFKSERARQAVQAAGICDDEIIFHPVAFDNYTPSQQYYALGIPKVCLCVDEARSEWSPCLYLDGETPMSRGFLRLYGEFFRALDQRGQGRRPRCFQAWGGTRCRHRQRQDQGRFHRRRTDGRDLHQGVVNGCQPRRPSKGI
jgi:hypothetical protein